MKSTACLRRHFTYSLTTLRISPGILGILLIGHFSTKALATVLYVNSASGGGNGESWETAFPNIQEAIDTAAGGDEIWVAKGTYRGTVQLRDGISLLGGFAGTETNRSLRNWNIHSSILDGGNTNRVVNVPSLSLPTRLDGFVIQNGAADFGGGIYSAGGEFISANNLFLQNNGAGIFGGGGAFVDETKCWPDQTPIFFFTNLANRLLQLHSPDLHTGQIQIFPTNRYTPEVQRSLQLAANIYDATTNRGASYPYYPSVFRPLFTNENGNIFITGFVEATNDAFVTNQWLALDSATDRNLLINPAINSYANLFGQPVIIGAKKGFPNFNEFSMETVAQVSRMLELRKANTNSPVVITQTNQMYLLSITNIFGVESWNSYLPIFPRPLDLRVSHTFTASITDDTGTIIWPTNGLPFSTNFISPSMVISNWPGVFSGSNAFPLPYFTNLTTLSLSQYLSSTPHFQAASTNFESNVGYAIPQWLLNLSNRIQYVAIDSGRVVDFVSLDGPNAQIDLTKDLLNHQISSPYTSEPTVISRMWNKNRLDGSTNASVPTEGIRQQILISMGIPTLLSDENWIGYSSLKFINKERAVAEFSKFMGITPMIPGYQNIPMPQYLRTLAPFAPTRKIYHRISLQANDPLVHFQMRDLVHGPADLEPFIPPLTSIPLSSNLKKLNDFCRPYPQLGFNRYPQYNSISGNPAFTDKEIGWSSDWSFPTNNCFNVQWLDKIHRGTPWQTLYTGSSQSDGWESWSGSAETNPTNDWKIIEMFLAERNTLGTSASLGSPVFVNNTFAANNGTGGAASFAASATFLNNIVANNSSGLLRLPVTNDVLLQTNCVINNAQFNLANLTNISGDLTGNPQFIAAANGNFRLLATSPLIDAGNENAFASGWLLDEPARLQGAGPDLGAFELSANDAPVFISPGISNGVNQFSFQVTGLSGESYVVETSTNLVEWLPISTNTTANGLFSIYAPINGASYQFYRAVHLP